MDRRLIDTVLPVNDDDAVLMAARLAKELGLGVGISSGANLLGAIELTRRGFGPAATVFADDSKKYLTTALAAPAPAREGFLSPRVELLAGAAAMRPTRFSRRVSFLPAQSRAAPPPRGLFLVLLHNVEGLAVAKALKISWHL